MNAWILITNGGAKRQWEKIFKLQKSAFLSIQYSEKLSSEK
jgi:hypothetical protein